MLQHMTGGAWGMMIRRILEPARARFPRRLDVPADRVRPLPALHLAVPEVVAQDAILQQKALYLNAGFFYARAAVFFAVWIALALTLSAGPRRRTRRHPPATSAASAS